MKTLFRNLICIIRRFKLAYTMNLLGTATAFASFMLIMMQICYERGFDKCLDKSENIYRLTSNFEYPFNVVLPRGVIEEYVKSSPYIEAGGAIADFDTQTYFSVTESNGLNKVLKLPIICIEPDVVNVFGFKMITGSSDCIESPDKALIPASLAKKMFGTVDVVGRAIENQNTLWLACGNSFTVGGVYADFPSNTQLKNVVYLKMNDIQKGEMNACNFLGYFRVTDGTNVKAISDAFNKKLNDYNFVDGFQIEFKATPIESIYYLNESGEGIFVKCGSKSVSNTLLIIALVIIIISIINHINFNLALVPMRIRSINIQKVLGCNTNRLLTMLVLESVIACFAAWLIGLFMVYLVGGTWLTSFLIGNLSIQGNIGICTITGIGSLLIGVLAGIYPATIQTSINPAIALKGSFGKSHSGRRMRTLLLTIQYVASAAFVAAACFVWLQNKYMLANSSLSAMEQVVQAEVPVKLAQQHLNTFVNRLKENPSIMNVAFGQNKVGATDTYTTNAKYAKDGSTYNYQELWATKEILDVFGVKVIEGCNFTNPSLNNDDAYAIATKSMKELSGIVLNESMAYDGWGKFIGIIDNINITSMRKESKPILFMSINKMNENINFSNMYVRIAQGANMHESIKYITDIIHEFIPEYPIEFEFYDDVMNQLYHSERALSSELVFFSLLAIMISIIGIFGMVMFDCEYHRKDNAVRRVLGANMSNILTMANKRYIKLLLVGFAISIPVVVIFINDWLKGFVSHIDISWGVFALVLVALAAITSIIVTTQTWSSASENPINNLKSE